MPEFIQQCPVCQSSKLHAFLTCTDYTVSHQDFHLVRCEQCTFTFTNPRPTEEEIGRYYQSEDYISHSNTSKGFINTAYQLVRKYTLQKKLTLIRSFLEQSEEKNKHIKLLDIGCGTGRFLKACKDTGWDAYGTEPDEKARQIAVTDTSCMIQADFLTSYVEEKFDVITLWHVLEHIHQLHLTLEKISATIKDDGHLIVAVPNLLSWDAQKYQQYWAAYDVPRHLYHFSPRSIQELFANFGFKIVDTIPMIFDAFYISMLSTKYAHTKTKYLEAFLTGIKSNRWASKNNKNYSSLIYHLRKE